MKIFISGAKKIRRKKLDVFRWKRVIRRLYLDGSNSDRCSKGNILSRRDIIEWYD